MNDTTKSILQLIDEKNDLRRQLTQALLELEETRNSRARAYIEARREVAGELNALYRIVNGRLDNLEVASQAIGPIMTSKVEHSPNAGGGGSSWCTCAYCTAKRNSLYHADRTWNAPK